MITAWDVFQSSFALVLVYAVACALKWKGILKEEHGSFLSSLLLNVCIPAAIFASLAREPIRWNLFFGPLIMYSAEIFGLLIAFLAAGKLLRLKPAQTGAVILCSAFGATTTVGMAFIQELYQGQWKAFTEAVISAQVGVAALFFVVGVPLAVFFGQHDKGLDVALRASCKFFRSPVFLSLVAGVLWNVFGLPGASDKWLGPMFKFLGLLQGAIGLLAGLAVGLMLRPVSVRTVLGAVVVVVVVKLILMPVFTGAVAFGLGFDPMWRGVLVVLSAMPSAVIAALFCRQYGCDGPLASLLVIVSTIVSVATLPIVYSLMMRGL
ncbi:AEC family transporter [Oscillatoria amoena NRMC-F 0135]|nr:AEC family transporter [Oscillatoria laete-virens]MDL5051058.1 AEC family transporter [Oscillatoria amoena NRMC-F 0135]MDL5054505.1 AEC family transporter [Oscillatoria laete-virens NRMC-F 0139]